MTVEKQTNKREMAAHLRGGSRLFVSLASFSERFLGFLERLGCPTWLVVFFAYLVGHEIFATLAGWRTSSR